MMSLRAEGEAAKRPCKYEIASSYRSRNDIKKVNIGTAPRGAGRQVC
jgi:hypothetical protein